MMELTHFISLIVIFGLNVLFFFLGLVLNSVVVLSFYRSAQLRRKLCYFMIMVLSCCDLLVVLTSHPTLAVLSMLWLMGKVNKHTNWMPISTRVTSTCVAVSLLALFVMNFDRYLATYHPIFHRTSVTKRKLFTFFLAIITFALPMGLLSISNHLIPIQVGVLVFVVIVFPPMFFVNYKLLAIVWKSVRNNTVSTDMKRTFSFKKVTGCLLAVACCAISFIPIFVYLGLYANEKATHYLPPPNNAYIAGVWAQTISAINSTLNCLIFYWKNKILRKEGKKVIRNMKICQRAQFSDDTEREVWWREC